LFDRLHQTAEILAAILPARFGAPEQNHGKNARLARGRLQAPATHRSAHGPPAAVAQTLYVLAL